MLSGSVAVAMPALEPGVSQSLAQWRSSHYRDIHYSLAARIDLPAERLVGRVEIALEISAGADLVLDWRPAPGARATVLHANGTATYTARHASEHLVIPANALRTGRNVVALEFESPIAVAGSAITRYRDAEDGADYVYSLFVPADASTAFPCIDQPDLKARFALELATPADWLVVANSPRTELTPVDGMMLRHRFAPSEPISTYLFAFAAGPFATITDEVSGDPTRIVVRRSRLARARAESAEVLRLNREAVRYFERYFGHVFPFAKYDLVLIPQFPYAGMEHAGATFLREEAVLFPSLPSTADRLRRTQLIFHETCHQWFGNLVTMRWFDDLWLKEGFANFMAAKATAAILPDQNAWLAFHQLKLAAYRTDITAGTTPIYQPIANLSAAKSAYGSIVYSKAPAVLRQAEFLLGEAVFERAVRSFVAKHRYAAADWRDLVGAFERASGRRLTRWADAWVRRAGMPELSVRTETDQNGRIRDFAVVQNAATIWPMRIQIKLVHEGTTMIVPVELSRQVTRLPALVGQSAPQFVLPNTGDFGYGRFRLDRSSRAAAARAIDRLDDPLDRALVWHALWEDVRDAALSPVGFIEQALAALPGERDELVLLAQLARIQTAFRAYLSDQDRVQLADTFESTLIARIQNAAAQSERITFLRVLTAVATGARGLDHLRHLLSGAASIPDVTLSPRDRYRILQRLATIGDPAAESLLQAQIAADSSDDARRYAFGTRAAARDIAVKAGYFERFLADRDLPESWIEEALGPFNAIEHAALTEPFLERALDALPEHKRARKIFFVNAWLAAFIGGQTGGSALATVRRFVARDALDPDLRRKVLEAMDELERTVRVRERYPAQ